MDLIHDPENHRFYCVVDGLECYIEYMISEDGAWDFFHTFVPMKLRGRGLTKEMYEGIEPYLDRHNIKVRASCPYAEKFFNEEHHVKYYADQHT